MNYAWDIQITGVARVIRDDSKRKKTTQWRSAAEVSSNVLVCLRRDHFFRGGAGISSASSASSERHRYQLASERYGRQRLACRRMVVGVTGRPRR
jgi:hypothetical protein